MKSLFLGIDVGATKTHFRLVNDNEIEREEIIASSKWRQGNWNIDASTLAGMISKGYLHENLRAVAIGAHGCDNDQEIERLKLSIKNLVKTPTIIRNDAELLTSAMGLEKGIGVISGTGSIAVTRSSDDKLFVAGGYGWILGEEGGAAGLVREAARRCNLKYSQTGQYEQILTNLLEEKFQTPPTKFNRFLMEARSGAEVGQFASVIFEAAEMGSDLAKDIILGAAKALVDLVLWLSNRIQNINAVVYGGGLISSQNKLEAAVKAVFEREFGSKIDFHVYKDAPVIGACRLAQTYFERIHHGI